MNLKTHVPAVTPPISPANVLSSDFDISKIKKKSIDLRPILGKTEKLAFILEKVLTKEECLALIKLSEDTGYSVAKINAGGGQEVYKPNVRGGHRLLIDNPEFTQKLFDRISPHLPLQFLGEDLIGINERLRFLKYDKAGQKFAAHMDGSYMRPDESAATLITLQIYLNEGFKGGNTTFLNLQTEKSVPVIPKMGNILVFEHKIIHEGSEMKSGIKYTIRLDVLYTHNSKLPN